MKTRLLFAVAVLTLSCNRNRPAAPQDATVSRAMDAASGPATEVRDSVPENLLVTLRGATVRRALPLLLAQSGGPDIVEQLARQVTPGIADHGDEIDVDSSFVAAGVVGGEGETTLNFYVAWPLRPGMQIAQDAREGRGWRRAAEGLYEPTSRDAGAEGDHRCWVGRREPVGWTLLCGPREGIGNLAAFLRRRLNAPIEQNLSLEMELRPGLAGRLSRRQLAELETHAPPSADGGIEGLRRAMFEEARRSANLFTSIATDVDMLRGSITQDDNNLHLRVELGVTRASSDHTRAIIASAAGRQASPDLLRALPATVQAWVVGGFDHGEMVRATGETGVDPSIRAQAGPELARVMSMIESIKNITPLGERVDAYSNADGYTMFHVIHRANAAQFVSDLRIAMQSIPSRPLPDGGNLRDLAVVMPTPGLTGLHYLRVGRNVNVPPGVQLPPEVRAAVERSMLLVGEGDRLIAVMGRDPIAQYRAMSQGPRLNATVPANAVFAGHITPPSFSPLFYGSTVPGLQVTETIEGIDFSLTVERRGEGAHAELRADSPIPAGLEIRGLYAAIQELQQRMLQQMAEQQRAAQQGGGPRPGPRPGGGGQRPQLDPSLLPEPPHFQLQPPQ